jgi:hypothetical protein
MARPLKQMQWGGALLEVFRDNMKLWPNDLLVATPVCALLTFLGYWPGAPEQVRSVASHTSCANG